MYTIIELQTTNGVTAAIAPVVKGNIYEANQEYHMKLMYAAVSPVEIHTVILLDEKGRVLKCEYFEHEQTAGEE